MTGAQFNTFWNSRYPGTIPISHYFKHHYQDRWFRIHSLPASKRYAESKEEWDLLLKRQNEIITDLLGENASVLLVTGDHYSEGVTEAHPITAVKSMAGISFVSADPVDLHKLSLDEYDEGQVFRTIFSEQIWRPGKFDDLLKDIADDEVRAFFISIENETIVAPYDGGIDFIVRDTETRDIYKEKYREWLSGREDGL